MHSDTRLHLQSVETELTRLRHLVRQAQDASRAPVAFHRVVRSEDERREARVPLMIKIDKEEYDRLRAMQRIIMSALHGVDLPETPAEKLAKLIEAVREDQVSLGMNFGTTRAEQEERRRALTSFIAQNAERIDDLLEQWAPPSPPKVQS
jgi:hypothetical protein